MGKHASQMAYSIPSGALCDFIDNIYNAKRKNKSLKPIPYHPPDWQFKSKKQFAQKSVCA